MNEPIAADVLREILAKHVEWDADYRLGEASLSDPRRANLSGANLSDAYLRDANLSDANLSGAYLRGANLRGANLSGANLSDAYLRGANLRDAYLRGANLSGAYLPFDGVPVVKDIDAQILAAITDENGELRTAKGESGDEAVALDMSTWHNECGTTHCRAGWAITLAGAEGSMMEKILGPAVAGTLIYAASRPGKPIPDFYASNDDALASIRADAGGDSMNSEIATPPKKPSVYIEVTCKGETVHAYTIAAPLQERPELRSPLPLVPRFCAYCKPPEKTGPHGIATDRKFNVAGGIFIGSWRHTRVDDVNQPVGDPQPIEDVHESVHAA